MGWKGVVRATRIKGPRSPGEGGGAIRQMTTDWTVKQTPPALEARNLSAMTVFQMTPRSEAHRG